MNTNESPAEIRLCRAATKRKSCIAVALAIALAAGVVPAVAQAPGIQQPVIFSLLAGSSSLSSIESWPSGYFRDGTDILMINGGNDPDISAVNTLAAACKSAFPNSLVGVRTFGGLVAMNKLKNASMPNVDAICYTYEILMTQGGNTGTEWTDDWPDVLTNYQNLQDAMAGSPYEIWTDPTGRGLPHRENPTADAELGVPHTGGNSYDGWDYAKLGLYVDRVIVQAQGNAREEWDGTDPGSYADAIDWMVTHMINEGIGVEAGAWFMQITIGHSSNAITDGQGAYDDVFFPHQANSQCPGLFHWFQQSEVNEAKIFMDNLVVDRASGSTPLAPSALTATTISASQINLSWTDNSTDETGFKLERKTGAGGTYAQIAAPGANVTTYNDTGLAASTAYFYRVRATNANGDSAYSNEASATTQSGGGAADLDIAQAGSAPTIDGTIDSVWSGANSKPIANLVGGTVSGASDLSGSFRTLWDANNLYVLAEITDDAQQNDSGTSTHNDDSVEVYVDANNDKLTSYGTTDFRYRFTWNGSSVTIGEPANGATTGVVAARAAVTGGYVMEVKIPWSTLQQANVAVDALLGLDVHVNDDDDGGARDGKLAWFNTADTSWQDPSTFATAKLVAGGTVPAAPSALTATAISDSQIDLAWTDNSSDETGFKLERKTGAGGTYAQIATPGADVTTYNDTGLAASTTYYYRVRATNANGDSAYSNEANATTQASADTTPPTVSISSPPDQATVSGTISVTADASDNVGVVGVQFKLDGANLGAEDTTSPYSVNWDTTTATDGAHALTAVARDAAGNSTTSTAVNVTVDNAPAPGLISDLVVNDADNAVDWSLRTNIQNGDLQYGDRTYTFTSVPALVAGSDWIRTANDSKAYTGATLVTFKVNAGADVYVAHNDAIATKPSWLSGWTDTGSDLVNDEASPKTFSLFTKFYTSGSTVSLGNNGSTGSGMYTIVVKTQSSDLDIVQAGSAPTIDGTIDSVWSEANSKTIANLVSGTVSGASDLSGSFRTLWDANNLYVLAEVTDDVQQNDSGTSTSNDDSVEVYVDANNDKVTSYGTTDYRYRFTWNGSSVTIGEAAHGATTGVVAARAAVTGGYVMEVKIPWSTLQQANVVVGALLGLDVHVNDDDDGGDRDGKLAWFNTADTSWQDPSTFAIARLAGASQ